MQREKFGSRLGFILISAGCAIGLGNVWRFPYIVGEYGGGLFILIYLLFLVLFGLPIMTMEFAVGRASQRSIASSFNVLEPKGTKWHLVSWMGVAGNYLLMMFYTTITGLMFAYFFKMIKGDFEIPEAFIGKETEYVSAEYDALVANPWIMVVFMVLAVVLGFLICSLGLKNGVEKINKIMMLALLAIIIFLAVRTITLPGAGEGLYYYLVPDFNRMAEYDISEVIFAALGQAFFTLSIGMGSMAIFGTYISKDRRLLGESITVASLDTFVAFTAGLIVIPSCFAFGIDPAAGPDLIFKTLPNVFNSMAGGRIWGSLFFLFMVFAAMSTVTAVFENIISFGIEKWGWSRKKSCAINLIAIIFLSLPCVLGYNLLSGVQPLGAGSSITDFEDFIISNNILPLGSLAYVLFCTLKRKGWGWNKFIEEANTGKGVAVPKWLRVHCSFIIPVLLVILWIWGWISIFI